MANPTAASGPANLDPQAAIAKHAAVTQANAAADQATITRIETAIKNSPMGWLQAQMGEVDSRASSEKGQVQGKINEQKDLVASNQKDAPKDAGSPPHLGQPAQASVKVSSASTTAAGGAVPAAGGGAAAADDKKVAAKSGGRSAKKADASPATIAEAVGGATSDAQVDGMLNAYQPKGEQAPAMIGRIKQMKSIADGFHGQLDVYVAQGGAVEGAIAATANFFKAGKDASAVWATNPYRKAAGLLGSIMTGMSALKSVTAVVGTICGKIGLVLTVVGLLGMIFPPIGVAVSGIARILNVIGLICDAISFVLAAILTGLNGVVLAKQIASGASAEEKAATADLMMQEANLAAGGLINMALMFGPRFMKGLTGSSRGVLASLIRKFKAVVGKVSLKLTGGVKHIANRIVRKMGFGGAKMGRVNGAWKDVGLMARTKEAIGNNKVVKLFNSAPAKLDSLQDWSMKKWGSKGWAKKLDKIGAWSGATANKWDIQEKVGNWGESAGKKLGGIGADTKFGQKLAHEADSLERETRREAMKQAQKDAMHLEQTRWQNHLGDRQRKQQGDGMEGLSGEGQTAFAKSRGDKVGAKMESDFDLSEKGRTAKLRQGRTASNQSDQLSSDYAGDPNFRKQHMDELHSSRERRWQWEEATKGKEASRKKLLGIEKRTPEQELELSKLNDSLKGLDRVRADNLAKESELTKLSGMRQREVHNWADVADNADAAIDPALELLQLKEERAAWRFAEKHHVRKSLQWNRDASTGNAAGRGGAGSYAAIKAAQHKEQIGDFAAFVALGRPTPTVGATTRSMLASINRAPAPAPAPAQTPTVPSTTPAPTPATPSTSTATTVASMTANVPAPSAGGDPTQQTPAMPDASARDATADVNKKLDNPVPDPVAAPDETGGADPGDGGDEVLPYWPALLPDFDHATADFGYMRKVATEFKRAQLEGKQKAVDTLAAYGQYEEYAKARQAHAKKHQADSQNTQKDAGQNANQAGTSAQSASTGEQKQGEARGAANNRAAVDLPEPESRGFWGRILSTVKRWAKNKAGQIFGWIQEKVASVVLKGLCGVSMGDLREYGAALRHQQMAAQGVAGGAAQTSGAAAQESIKLGGNAAKEAQSAADAIGECDANIVEADGFISDVTSFEAQLAQEKAHAQVFLGQVYAAVHAEQARKRAEAEAEAQRRAQEAQQAAHGDQSGGDGPQMSVDPGAASHAGGDPGGGSDPSADADHDGIPDHGETEAARYQIRAAAAYISDTAGLFQITLEGRAQDYQNQLKLAAKNNRTGDDAQGNDLEGPAKRGSNHLLEDFRAFVQSTKTEMDGYRDVQIDPSSAGRIADEIVASADDLDRQFSESMTGLDVLFERTYVGIREGRRDLKTRILGDDNIIGNVNRGLMEFEDTGYETVSPVMNRAWDVVSAPIQVPRNGGGDPDIKIG